MMNLNGRNIVHVRVVAMSLHLIRALPSVVLTLILRRFCLSLLRYSASSFN